MAALICRFHGSHATTMKTAIRPRPGALPGPSRVYSRQRDGHLSSLRAMPLQWGVLLLGVAMSIPISVGAGAGWHMGAPKNGSGEAGLPGPGRP